MYYSAAAVNMNRYLITYISLVVLVILQYNIVASKFPLNIVNGTTAEEGEFPYTVQLRDEGELFACGGSIIGPEWILTTGSCIAYSNITTVIYGTNKLYDYEDGTPNTSITVKDCLVHPNYSYPGQGVYIYDIALVQLDEPIPFSENAQPIQLPSEEDDTDIPYHVDGMLSGWGRNESYGYLPPYLQKISLQLLTDEECSEIIDGNYTDPIFLPSHHLCSNDYYNGQCFGDIGSPYVINGIQYGMAAWYLTECGVYPGGYTRITNPEYREWIRNVTDI